MEYIPLSQYLVSTSHVTVDKTISRNKDSFYMRLFWRTGCSLFSTSLQIYWSVSHLFFCFAFEILISELSESPVLHFKIWGKGSFLCLLSEYILHFYQDIKANHKLCQCDENCLRLGSFLFLSVSLLFPFSCAWLQKQSLMCEVRSQLLFIIHQLCKYLAEASTWCQRGTRRSTIIIFLVLRMKKVQHNWFLFV